MIETTRKSDSPAIMAADLFCGAGGGSNGFVAACDDLGLRFDLLAINHWSVAIDTHQTNHPNVRHLCENLDCVWPRKVVPGGKLQFALFAPECTSHSRARGGKPKNDQSRATAWHVVRWAEELDIECILVENVKEFIDWGPLYPADHPEESLRGKPDKAKKGLFFRDWCASLRKRGYKIEYRILNAAWFGGATSRERFFLQAKKKGKITWPEATHEAGDNLFGKPKYVGAEKIIDWKLKGKSIYGRKKPLADNTMRRIYAGLEKFSGMPFIVPQFTSQDARSIERPLGTLTTQSRGVGLCEPFLVVLRRCADAKSIDEPAPTICANGGHIALAQPFVVPVTHQGGASRAYSLENPLSTVTGANRGELALIDPCLVAMEHTTDGLRQPQVKPFVVKYHGSHKNRQDGDKRVHSVEEPIKTLDTQPRFGVAQPFIVPVTHSHSGDNVHSVDDPLRTITTAKGGEFAIAEPVVTDEQGDEIDLNKPWLISFKGQDLAKSVEVPLGTLTTHERFGVCQAYVLGQQSCAAPRSVEEPLPTVAGAGAISIIEPFIVGAGGPSGQGKPTSIENPLGTLLSENHRAIVEPFIVPNFGENGNQAPRTHDVNQPIPTVTSRGAGNLVQPFIIPYYGNSSATSVDDPLDTVTCKHRFALIQPELLELAGYDHSDVVGILDIRFRMLQTHELGAAMGFPPDYVFTGNKEQQVKQIGNAIEFNVVKALCTEILKPYTKVQSVPRKSMKRRAVPEEAIASAAL